MKKNLLILFILFSFLSAPAQLVISTARGGVIKGHGNAPASSYLLNTISATPIGAYSVRRLKSTYLGAALRVVRLSDNAEIDLAPGFTKVAVDDFGAGATVKVVRIYDQSGNGRDLTYGAEKPVLSYLNRPMIDHSNVVNLMFASSGANHVAISAPKLFYAVDPQLGSRTLSAFYDYNSSFRFQVSVAGQRWNLNNGIGIDNATVIFDKLERRGTQQLMASFQSGSDFVRVNGRDLSYYSGANAGDTPATNAAIMLGDLGGNAFPFAGRIGEYLIFDGAISTADRAAIETSQMTYFQNGRRLYIHGDSLSYGANLANVDTQSVGTWTRNLLGDGWDIYMRGISGTSLNNVEPAANQRMLAVRDIDPLYRSAAQSNVLVLWTGWNDLNGGENYASLRQAFINYVAERKAANPGMKVVLVSMPVSGVAPMGGLINYNFVRAAINADMLVGYHTIFGADAYANVASDPLIGDGANPFDTTYWQEGLHMTAAGYARAAPYIAAAVEAAEAAPLAQSNLDNANPAYAKQWTEKSTSPDFSIDLKGN